MTFWARARRALPTVLAAAIATFAPGRQAHAQTAPQSAADALFTEGRELLEKGRFAEACLKLAKSEELAPAVGTLLNLGYCWEQAGRLRSAMEAYAEAEALAGGSGETKRAGFARERYAAVEQRAMKLVVRIAPPEVPGLQVKRNGVVMLKADFDRPSAVDPGDYGFTAAAAGYAPWRGAVVVKGEGSVVTMIVPPLGEKAAAITPDGTWLGARRFAALGLGALSALAIGGGVGTAFSAKSRYDDAAVHCDAGGCDETGNAIQRGAVTQGNIATALIGLGLLAGGAGVYLWIVGAPEPEKGASPPPPPARKASLNLEVRPLGAALSGLF